MAAVGTWAQDLAMRTAAGRGRCAETRGSLRRRREGLPLARRRRTAEGTRRTCREGRRRYVREPCCTNGSEQAGKPAEVGGEAIEAQKASRDLVPLSEKTFITTDSRVVAIGDVHGDLQKTVAALKLAGVLSISAEGAPVWCGGDTVVVQLGDILDRGDHEIQILHLFLRLKEQAKEQGGDVFLLNGNHESLNICGDFRYVTSGGFVESARVAGLPPEMAGKFQAQLKARVALFAPGGPIARELANSYTALQINDTVFAHGGIMPHHVDYGLGRLNDEMSRWMRGEEGARSPMAAMGSPDSVLWCREYSREIWKTQVDRSRSCALLSKVLNQLSANQMVVGHTPQEMGCNCECNGRIWRIDVGMSSGVCNALAQVLEIQPPGAGGTPGQSTMRVLKMEGSYPASLSRGP
mmetsp:Transcript_12607/g.35169  ORF Transcript_12607/g.35169 Transcript_12607/m.35169 type:complete len:409 (-) Transcript_12607:1856-3082(-)